MPVLEWEAVLTSLARRAADAASSHISTRDAINATSQGIDVVCAWPVSGQYGPGTRVLYYILIAACVFARKAEYIKNACLAGALLFPAVAAIHGIVLAAFHREGAVDMDIYGAFQFCAIGILVAPVTVRLSRTYFYDPGRNTIFLWAGLILAGLLSLTVEFYRANTFKCTDDGNGHLVSPDRDVFPYSENTTCGLVCSPDVGPFSPMRGGAANNIYVIPVPDTLTFGTGTLIAAACCVHAILWLASMLDKILEINWKSRFGLTTDELRINAPIEGTNGATIGKMRTVNETIRFFMGVAAVPVFTGAACAVLIVGEINFYSRPVRFMNEPMANAGQWSPIVGTILAAVGSLYLVLAADMQKVREEEEGSNGDNIVEKEHHCCTCQHHPPDSRASQSPSSRGSGSLDRKATAQSAGETSHVASPPMEQAMARVPSHTSMSSLHGQETSDISSPIRPSFSNSVKRGVKRVATRQSARSDSVAESDAGNRRRVAKMLIRVGNSLGTATHQSFDVSKFREGKALEFPEIPGEQLRNQNLAHIKEIYSRRQEADGTPALQAARSRASSFVGSIASGQGIERASRDLSRSPSPLPSTAMDLRQRASTLPVRRPQELRFADSPPGASSRGRERKRRDTLEVPSRMDIQYLRTYSPAQAGPSSAPTSHPASSPMATSALGITDAITSEPASMSGSQISSPPPKHRTNPTL